MNSDESCLSVVFRERSTTDRDFYCQRQWAFSGVMRRLDLAYKLDCAATLFTYCLEECQPNADNECSSVCLTRGYFDRQVIVRSTQLNLTIFDCEVASRILLAMETGV